MAKINQEALETVITNGYPHTLQSLKTLYTADHTMGMQIDRTIQKLRRNGKIKMKREGRNVIWKAVQITPTEAPGIGSNILPTKA